MGVREREEAPDTFGIFVSFKVQSGGWEVLPSHPESLYNILERRKAGFCAAIGNMRGRRAFIPR